MAVPLPDHGLQPLDLLLGRVGPRLASPALAPVHIGQLVGQPGDQEPSRDASQPRGIVLGEGPFRLSVSVLIALLVFSLNNWSTVEVKIWEGLIWETRLPALVVLSFLLGLVPMWLLHVAGRWRLKRRINVLEAVARQPSAALTTTQLDAAAQEDETPAT